MTTDKELLTEYYQAREKMQELDSCIGLQPKLENSLSQSIENSQVFHKIAHDSGATTAFEIIYNQVDEETKLNLAWDNKSIDKQFVSLTDCEEVTEAEQFPNVSDDTVFKSGVLELNERSVHPFVIGEEMDNDIIETILEQISDGGRSNVNTMIQIIAEPVKSTAKDVKGLSRILFSVRCILISLIYLFLGMIIDLFFDDSQDVFDYGLNLLFVGLFPLATNVEKYYLDELDSDERLRAEEKSESNLFDVSLRVIAWGRTEQTVENEIESVLDLFENDINRHARSLKQSISFSRQYNNENITPILTSAVSRQSTRKFEKTSVLSSEELSSFYHAPSKNVTDRTLSTETNSIGGEIPDSFSP